MADLREQLRQLLQGRVCFMGLGNVDYGDDGFGVRLAEELKSEGRNPNTERRPKPETQSEGPGHSIAGYPSDFGFRPSFGLRPSAFGLRLQFIIAGTTPERYLGTPEVVECDHLIFLDAVDFGGAPGSVVLLNSEEMAARYPQISTHKISLGLLAKCAEANGTTKAWLLGAQPQSLKPGAQLSSALQATLQLLLDLLRGCSSPNREGERPREPKHLRTPEQIRAREDARPPGRDLEVMA